MSQNYGGRSRDLLSAVANILLWSLQDGLFAEGTVAAYTSDFSVFRFDFLKPNKVKRLEDIKRKHVVRYGKLLAMDVIEDRLSAQTAHGRISAINSVMDIATSRYNETWQPVYSVGDCGIPPRNFVRRTAPGGLIESAIREVSYVALAKDPHTGHLATLARALGVRAEEASLLDCRKALRDAVSKGYVIIERGSKGGRRRIVTIRNHWQIEVLRAAADSQGRHSCLILPELNYAQFLNGPMRCVREGLKSVGLSGFHELRAAFACEFYEDRMGVPAPCVSGISPPDRERDLATRKELSPELGHKRPEVTGGYIGGR